MGAFLIADITVHDMELYKEYVKQVPGFIAKHGGQYRVRGGDAETREGNWRPQRLIVLEFPSRASALAFLEDPGYQPVAAIRHAAATTNMVIADTYVPA